MPRRVDRGEVAADLAEYVAARRPDLVRLGVLMGSPPGHAAVLADRTLVRVAADWRDLRDDAAPDDRLLHTALEERTRDRTPWWEDGPAPSPDGAASSPGSAPAPTPALDADVARHLDRLPVADRARLVWAALGHGPSFDPARESVLAAWAAGLAVPPPTGARPGRHLAAPVLSVVAVVAALLVAGLAVSLWPRAATGPSEEDPLTRVEVTERANPAPLGWYADGRLHLAGFTAPVDGVRAFVEVAGGAVYLDQLGRVVRLERDGSRRLLGRADGDAGLVGSSVFGRVAWVTEDGAGLEVVDVATGEVVARRGFDAVPPNEQPAPARLVRMSGAEVRYTESGREHVWDTANQTLRTEAQGERGALVDEVGTTQLRQVDADTVAVEQGYGRGLVVDGVGVEVSRRQQFVLTLTGEGGRNVGVVSVATREPVDSGTTRDDVVLAARFSDADRITYLLADRAALPDASEAGRLSATGPLEVRTCQVRTGVCVVHTSGPGAAGTVLLAR